MAQFRVALADREWRLFRFMNRRLQSHALDVLMPAVTLLGSAGFCIALCLALALLGKGAVAIAGVRALVALTASHLVSHFVKAKIARLRPFLVWSEVRTVGRLWRDYSFPSGHTTAAVSVALSLAGSFTPWAPLLIPLAVLVGMSRVYLGVHYPSDVAAGMVVGSLGFVVSGLFF